MEKRRDREELNDDLLDQVSGGFEDAAMQERWNQIVNSTVPGGARDTFDPERFQAYWDEKMRESDIITTVPDLDNPHSKKQKGMLYK